MNSEDDRSELRMNLDRCESLFCASRKGTDTTTNAWGRRIWRNKLSPGRWTTIRYLDIFLEKIQLSQICPAPAHKHTAQSLYQSLFLGHEIENTGGQAFIILEIAL